MGGPGVLRIQGRYLVARPISGSVHPYSPIREPRELPRVTGRSYWRSSPG